ncbi:MAG: hypothetical protein IV100_20495 [Myxococcales bacterium]|nr:hypothetical protein [Myxococcales bacterium]
MSGPRFEDVTAAAGLPTTVGQGVTSDYGSPAAWFDWDQDGWPDLVLGDRAGPTRLFRNESGNLPFSEESPQVLSALGGATCLLPFELSPGFAVDAPRPGLLVVHHDSSGDGHYGNAPGEVGALTVLAFGSDGTVDTIPIARPGTWLDAATAGDLDGDGHEDLVLGSYVCGGGAAHYRTLFRLERDALGFRLSGDDPILSPGCYPVPMMTDFHGDGRPVLMVATDYGTLEAQSFVYSGHQRYEPLPGVYGMGIGVSDTNGDGFLDYVLTSIGPDLRLTSRRPRIDGPPSHELGLIGRNTEWGVDGVRFKWGPAYLDADNDGQEELWITSGLSGLPGPGKGGNGDSTAVFNPEPNARDTLLQEGRDVGEDAGLHEVTGKRAVVLADFDRDGRMDALLTGLDSRFLYRNVSESGHWLQLHVPSRVGARYVVTGCGRTWTREWSGMQTVAAHDRVIHVGLGDCAGPVDVTVRWPWLAERALGAFDVDRIHEVGDPGTVWLEPATVTPGATVELRSTLPGRVTVAGVDLENGRGTFVAPNKAGITRLPVIWDGAVVALAPRLTVKEDLADVLVDPWPVRRGIEARVLASTDGVVTAGSNVSALDPGPSLRRLVPTGPRVTLRVGGAAVSVPSVDAISQESFAQYETVGFDVRVRVALVDDLGSATPTMAAEEGGTSVVAVVGSTSTPLTRDAFPFYSAYVPSRGETITVMVGGEEIASLGDPSAAGPLDLEESRLWVTTPIVRADGQDVVEAILLLRDSAARQLTPDATWTLTVPGGSAIDPAWTRIDLGQGASGWYSRARIGTEAGLLAVTAGPLSATVLALPPDPAEVTQMTTLERDGENWVLVPRDRFGQRLGSGIATDPPFTYVRWGVYTRPVESDGLTLRVGDAFTGVHDGTAVTWTTTAAASGPVGSCNGAPGRGTRGAGVLLLLLMIVGWRVGLGVPAMRSRRR